MTAIPPTNTPETKAVEMVLVLVRGPPWCAGRDTGLWQGVCCAEMRAITAPSREELHWHRRTEDIPWTHTKNRFLK